jgi:uncharacterized membrane protein
MRAAAAGAAKLATAAAVVLLPPVAYHLLILAQGGSALVVALGWLAVLGCVVAAARVAGAGAAGVLAAAAVVATAWVATRDTAFGVYFAPLTTWLLLLVVFGRTLRAGREPLVTALARACHDEPLSPDLARYTRGVTQAWCAFFAAVAGTLALFAPLLPLARWSLLANIGALPLVAAMFAAEYAVRVRRFPDMRHVSPLAMAARLGRAGWQSAVAGK